MNLPIKDTHGTKMTSMAFPIKEWYILRVLAEKEGKTMKDLIRYALANSHEEYKKVYLDKETDKDGIEVFEIK